MHLEGRGRRTLVFAHGLGCDQTIWRQLAPRFERDHRVVLFDYAGCGRAEPGAYDPTRYGSLEDYARDLTDVVRAVGGPAPVLVSHSISGSIGVLAQVASPGLFDRLVLLAPSPRFLNDPPDYVGGFERADVDEVLGLMEQNFLGWARTFATVAAPQPAIAKELCDAFGANDPRAVRRFAEITFLSDVRALLPRVKARTLVVQCSDDAIAPVGVGELMHRLLPDSVLRVTEAAGHVPQLSHPDRVEQMMREFLA